MVTTHITSNSIQEYMETHSNKQLSQNVHKVPHRGRYTFTLHCHEHNIILFKNFSYLELFEFKNHYHIYITFVFHCYDIYSIIQMAENCKLLEVKLNISWRLN